MAPSEILHQASAPPEILRQASCGGHGTYEAKELIDMLEEHGIICCLVGVSALVFYGAERMRHVCLPPLPRNTTAQLTSNRTGRYAFLQLR